METQGQVSFVNTMRVRTSLEIAAVDSATTTAASRRQNSTCMHYAGASDDEYTKRLLTRQEYVVCRDGVCL